MPIAPPIFSLFPASVAICLQEDDIPWLQHHSARVSVIIPPLVMSFEYILMVGLIQSFSKALLECGHVTVNMYNASFPNSWEHKIKREPRSVPK